MAIRKRSTGTQAWPPEGQGLCCPNCGCCHLDVDYTRDRAAMIRRRRICRNCRTQVYTDERIWKVRGAGG